MSFAIYHYWDGEEPIAFSLNNPEDSKAWNLFCALGMVGRRTDEPRFPQVDDYVRFMESLRDKK